MRKALTPWNLLGLFLFLVGILAYWQGQGGGSPHALPLPQGEATSPNRLPLVLYRPDPPKGFLKETLSLDLAPGETPEGKALGAWAEAVGAPAPKALYRLGQGLVVDLPGDFARGLDATGETFRLYSLAYTLLATFAPAEEVRFLVEGEAKPGLAHLDLSQPIRLP